jgi:hypothetical protein
MRNQMNNNHDVQNIRKPVGSKSMYIYPYAFKLIIGLGTSSSITHNDDERSTRHTSPRPYVEENDNNDERSTRHTSPGPYVEENDNNDEDVEDGTLDGDEEDEEDEDLDCHGGFEDVEQDRDADLIPMDTEDDNGIDRRPSSPQAGQKRPRCDSDAAHRDNFRKAIKVKNSKGRPKADDWETDVQEILAKAIIFYEIRLATDGLFPDHMQEVHWAKIAWSDGCSECDLKIHHNSELIKIVRLLLYLYPILMKHVSSRVVGHIFVVS